MEKCKDKKIFGESAFSVHSFPYCFAEATYRFLTLPFRPPISLKYVR